MKTVRHLVACASLVALLECCLTGQEPGILPTLTFSSPADGRRLLGTRDAFVERLSAFDRSARLKTDKAVPEQQFLEFAAKNVLAWEPPEEDQIQTVYRGLQPRLKDLRVAFPKTIHLIKTTGLEEGAAAYTRTNAIILPKQKLKKGVATDLLAHELFHVLSRHNPALRDRLYDSIGFKKCGEIPFPDSLASRKLTNPDAPVNEHAIRLEAGGEKVWVVPILFSSADTYDVSKGGEFFDYLEFRFLLVSKEATFQNLKKTYDPQSPVLFKQDQVSGFFEQIGRNTQYTIHPEEILADNFMILVTGKQNVASPEVQDRMKTLLLGK
jgi:hypothetical protein